MTQKQANAHFKKNRIYVDVFMQYVHVFFTKDDWIRAMIWREGNYNHDLYSYSGIAYESVLENHDIKSSDTLFAIGIFENDLSIAVHECVHIAGSILNFIGHREQKQGDEISAYLTQFLFKEVSRMMSIHYDKEMAK